MRHSIKKFTKEEVKSILSNSILKCTEGEVRALLTFSTCSSKSLQNPKPMLISRFTSSALTLCASKPTRISWSVLMSMLHSRMDRKAKAVMVS